MNKNINGRPVAEKLGTGRKSAAARLSPRLGADLVRERALAASVKRLEELFLGDPGISLTEISKAVLTEACRLTGSRFGFAGYVTKPAGRLVAVTLAENAGKKLQAGKGPFCSPEFINFWDRMLKLKKPLLINSAPSGRGAAGLPHGRIKINNFIGVPALTGRQALGILALANPRVDYSAAELEMTKQLARVYALILKRKFSEDVQRREHDGLLAIISSSQDIIYSAGLDGTIMYASPKTAAYGYKPKDLLGRSIFELLHPQDREIAVKALAKARETGKTLPMISYRIRKKRGGYFFMEQKSGIIMSGGKPALITGVVRDVGEKLGAEAALKESETMLRAIFDTTKDAIFIKDLFGRYVKINKACADVMLLTPEAAPGKTDADIFTTAAALEFVKDDREVIRTGRTIERTSDRVLPSGTYCFNTVKTPLRNAAGEIIGILGVARDVANVKKTESVLASARASEAMSKIARPMAHNFNNALAVINGHATLIGEEEGNSAPVKTGIRQILSAVKWAAEITTHLQSFVRNPQP